MTIKVVCLFLSLTGRGCYSANTVETISTEIDLFDPFGYQKHETSRRVQGDVLL